MTRTIDIDALRTRHAEGAIVLDVREPAEYVLSLIHISEPTRPY